MKKAILKSYAKLIVRSGLGLKKGQDVIIKANVDQEDFVSMVVKECYNAGAGRVTINWLSEKLNRINLKKGKLRPLMKNTPMEIALQEYWTDKLPCYLWLDSDDPDGAKGTNPKKAAKIRAKKHEEVKHLIEARENRYQWCIAAVPGVEWARKVFPGLGDADAVERLWEAILRCSRAYEGDPAENWARHNAFLADRCAKLNAMGLVRLEYSSANGTELSVGLIPEALFLGGAETNPVNGAVYNPNIPSEEVYVTPRAGDAEGIVYATRPFSYRGQLIEDFWIRFERGRAVDCGARRNEEALRSLIAMDEGSAMLGECALVPYMSPIRESGLMFYNTLFDENAACHLALGRGYSNNIRDYGSYTLAELRAMGVNDSMVHEDFMIGSADLAVTGITASGERIPVFTGGGWAF